MPKDKSCISDSEREILILFFDLWFLYNAMTKEPVYKESGRSF